MRTTLVAVLFAVCILIPSTARAQVACTAPNLHCAQVTWAQGTGGGTTLGNNVYRSVINGGCTTVTASTCRLAGSTTAPTTIFVDQPLAASTTYYYVITATNLSATGATQESAGSTQVPFTTTPDPVNPPSPPTGVSVSGK